MHHTQYANHSSDYESGTETKCDGLDNECDNDVDDDFTMTLMDSSTVISGGIGETCGVGECSGERRNATPQEREFDAPRKPPVRTIRSQTRCVMPSTMTDGKTDHTGGDGADLLTHDFRTVSSRRGCA